MEPLASFRLLTLRHQCVLFFYSIWSHFHAALENVIHLITRWELELHCSISLGKSCALGWTGGQVSLPSSCHSPWAVSAPEKALKRAWVRVWLRAWPLFPWLSLFHGYKIKTPTICDSYGLRDLKIKLWYKKSKSKCNNKGIGEMIG